MHFLQDSEVFITYGNLDNCNLLRSYGFIEKSPNIFDEVDIKQLVTSKKKFAGEP